MFTNSSVKLNILVGLDWILVTKTTIYTIGIVLKKESFHPAVKKSVGMWKKVNIMLLFNLCTLSDTLSQLQVTCSIIACTGHNKLASTGVIIDTTISIQMYWN